MLPNRFYKFFASVFRSGFFKIRFRNRSSMSIQHCDKSIWRPGNIPCYSWEHYQLQQGNIFPAQIPAIARFSPSYSWELSQLCFPCNCWYISQVQPGYCPRFSLGVVPAFYEVGENPSSQKTLYVCKLIVQWLGRQLAIRKDVGSILNRCDLIFFTSQLLLIVI